MAEAQLQPKEKENLSEAFAKLNSALGQLAEQTYKSKYGAAPTPLMDAVFKGDTAKARDLIMAGADITARNAEGLTAFIFAVQIGSPEVLDTLLKAAQEKGWNLSGALALVDKNGLTALTYACKAGNAKLIEMLCEAGAFAGAADYEFLRDAEGNPARDERGKPQMRYAYPLLEYLGMGKYRNPKLKINVNGYQEKPLVSASGFEFEFYKGGEKSESANGSINEMKIQKISPYGIFAEKSEKNATAEEEASGQNMPEDKENGMETAQEYKQQMKDMLGPELLEKFASKLAEIKGKQNQERLEETKEALTALANSGAMNQLVGSDAIMAAVKSGNEYGMLAILDLNPASLLHVDGEGRTPLIAAAVSGQEKIAKDLAELGVNLDAKDNEGKTALMYAAENWDRELAEALLNAGADPGAADNDGRMDIQGRITRSKTAADYAREGGNSELATFIETYRR